jgi:hypothetical protein
MRIKRVGRTTRVTQMGEVVYQRVVLSNTERESHPNSERSGVDLMSWHDGGWGVEERRDGGGRRDWGGKKAREHAEIKG